MGRLKGFLVTAVVVLVIVAIAWRVQAIRNLVFGG
jgi:hypothetical protein